MTKAAGLVALGMAAAGYEAVKAAGNFQDATTHLVTDAGESAKNLGMVQAGILNVSTATGTSASAITNAMYHIESAGYHGAAGLTLLKVAAEGARVGGADLDTVSKTLVGTMNAYGMSSKQAASFMNQLITTVGQGDMRMQDLASSLSNVAPLAAALHIQFSQVGGAIATMTAQGMSADQASQDLANTIRSLSNPNQTAIAEMNQLGVNAQTVAQNLGTKGLTGTLSELTTAITSHMGPAGLVIMNAFTQSTTAGQDLQIMLRSMPAQFRSLAQGFMAGSVSAKQWRADLQAQTPVNQHLMQQFASLYEKSRSFNSLLASGSPAAQTYTAALSKMMGGATGLNTALMLTGGRMPVFEANVAKIGAAARGAGSDVDNWGRIQSKFNFKMQSAKTAVENTGIAIGTALLPAATSLLRSITSIVEPIAEWTARHKTLTEVIFVGVGAVAGMVAVLGLLGKAYKSVTSGLDVVRKALAKLGIISEETAEKEAGSAQAAAAAQTEASAEEVAAAEASSAANVESAAVSSAGFVRTGIAAMVAAGRLVILKGVQLAQAAASKVAAAGQAIFNAVMDANPIMLVVIAIAALVAGVIYAYTHFKVFRDIVKDVFDWLKSAVSDVIGFVEAHWRLIITIIGGPLGLAVALVTKYWGDIKRWFSDGVHAVESILSWFGRLPGLFARWLGDTAGAVERGGQAVLSWFSALPGKILHYVAGFGSLLIHAGEQVVMGLIHGIEGAAGGLLHTVEGLASDVSHAFGSILHILSPSRVFDEHGQMIVAGLVQGIQRSQGQAVTAAAQMARNVSLAASGLGTAGVAAGVSLAGTALGGPGSAAAAGTGGTTIVLNVTGNTVMNTKDIDTLVSKIEKRLTTITLPSAGRTTRAF